MSGAPFHVNGKFVVVAGGSKGLGRELALMLIDRGANVTVIARSLPALEETRQLMERRVSAESQTVACQSVDLTDISAVCAYVSSLREPPTALFCVAGGTAEEVGFFADISPDAISSCMNKNYASSAFIAHAVLRRWVTGSTKASPSDMSHRHLVFTASTAAVVAIPGYAAYSPTKSAIRALADTLRLEVLMYNDTPPIKVHCSFPGTIYTDSFFQEQALKPRLCKEIEGTMDNAGGMTAADVAGRIINGLDKGNYFLTSDFQTLLLLSNMRGPSPKDSPLSDWFIGFLCSLVWPFVRMYIEGMVRRATKEESVVR